MTLLEAAKQALDALESSADNECAFRWYKNAATELRQAIENESRIVKECEETMADLEQAEQKPYCWVQSKLVQGTFYREKPRRIHTIPLYTAPLQREVEFLDDDEVIKLANEEGWNIQVENMPANLLRLRVGALGRVIQKEFWRKNA